MGSLNDIHGQLYFPIPDCSNIREPATKQEYLETLVANVKARQAKVKSNILQAAIDKGKTLASNPDVTRATQQNDIDPDAMEIDSDDQEDQASSDIRANGIELLLTNLDTPYEPAMGELCLKPPRPEPAYGSGSGSNAVIRRRIPDVRNALNITALDPEWRRDSDTMPPPAEVQLVQQTLTKLELYDQHAKQALGYYGAALRRVKERNGDYGGGEGREEPRRPPSRGTNPGVKSQYRVPYRRG